MRIITLIHAHVHNVCIVDLKLLVHYSSPHVQLENEVRRDEFDSVVADTKWDTEMVRYHILEGGEDVYYTDDFDVEREEFMFRDGMRQLMAMEPLKKCALFDITCSDLPEEYNVSVNLAFKNAETLSGGRLLLARVKALRDIPDGGPLICKGLSQSEISEPTPIHRTYLDPCAS